MEHNNHLSDFHISNHSCLYQLPIFPVGARVLPGGIRFSYLVKEKNVTDCGIILFDASTQKELQRIPFSLSQRIGDVFYYFYETDQPEKFSYCFYEKDRFVTDVNAVRYMDHPAYGSYRADLLRLAGFLQEFSWEGDVRPHIAYEDSFVYLLHTRGFTRHSSSKVREKGTFAGVIEKIPYLQSLGVTTLEFQPVNEFPECMPKQNFIPGDKQEKLNYWGYCTGNYYTPKSAYSSQDATHEFRCMVKALHQANIEVIPQFYFDENADFSVILDVLLHWIRVYHIDGAHLLGPNLPIERICAEPALRDLKVWNDHVENTASFQTGYYDNVSGKRLGLVEDTYLYNMRGFLKGDTHSLQNALRLMRRNPNGGGVINYFSTYWGFTMQDMVSYEHKHNEENGENNLDGCDFNCTWNCGEEGTSRKPRIKELRLRQLKNAMTLLFLSAGTPRIFMGDEFGNSQKGNNNPYCLDNTVTWLDWKNVERNKQLFDYVVAICKLRKENPMLHPNKEHTMLDEKSCGFPDLSYHGESAWKIEQTDTNSVGILFSNIKASQTEGSLSEKDLLYVGINCGWRESVLALPNPPKGYGFSMLWSTGEEPVLNMEQQERTYRIPPRTIVLFGIVKNPGKKTQDTKKLEIKHTSVKENAI